MSENGTNGVKGDHDVSTMLWQHPAPKTTQMWDFLQKIANKYSVQLKDYHDLYRWSIDNTADFWGETWDYTGIKASEPYRQVSRCHW